MHVYKVKVYETETFMNFVDFHILFLGVVAGLYRIFAESQVIAA